MPTPRENASADGDWSAQFVRSLEMDAVKRALRWRRREHMHELGLEFGARDFEYNVQYFGVQIAGGILRHYLSALRVRHLELEAIRPTHH